MKFIDATARDMQGAAIQMERYIRAQLGFDHSVAAEVTATPRGFQIYARGQDDFQQASGWEHRIGQLSLIENAKPEDDFESACKRAWERLERAMKRDERELRHGLKLMGALIEGAPSFTSEVGKLFAARIKTARDEATNHMIEHHGWKPAE